MMQYNKPRKARALFGLGFLETIPSPRLGFLRRVFLSNHLASTDCHCAVTTWLMWFIWVNATQWIPPSSGYRGLQTYNKQLKSKFHSYMQHCYKKAIMGFINNNYCTADSIRFWMLQMQHVRDKIWTLATVNSACTRAGTRSSFEPNTIQHGGLYDAGKGKVSHT